MPCQGNIDECWNFYRLSDGCLLKPPFYFSGESPDRGLAVSERLTFTLHKLSWVAGVLLWVLCDDFVLTRIDLSFKPTSPRWKTRRRREGERGKRRTCLPTGRSARIWSVKIRLFPHHPRAILRTKKGRLFSETAFSNIYYLLLFLSCILSCCRIRRSH